MQVLQATQRPVDAVYCFHKRVSALVYRQRRDHGVKRGDVRHANSLARHLDDASLQQNRLLIFVTSYIACSVHRDREAQPRFCHAAFRENHPRHRGGIDQESDAA